MGGKEASRGFLYQAFASVLEALCENNWDKLYMELDTDDEKVDIALECNGVFVKSIQVKSTINSFRKADIIKWVTALNDDDIGANEITLFLIGQCNDNAIAFINSVEKYQNNKKKLDKIAIASLSGFDTTIIENKKISFVRKNFDIESLQQMVRDSLHKYMSYRGIELSFDQINLIATTLVFDQVLSSTDGSGIDKSSFDNSMEERLRLLSQQVASERVAIGIRSFERGVKESSINYLSLLEMFEGRKIKERIDWNSDIYENVKSFLSEQTEIGVAYQISLDTHASVAFAAGRVLDSKSGIDVFPTQRNSTGGIELWDVKTSSKQQYATIQTTQEILDQEHSNVALILNITHNIYDDVIRYIENSGISFSRIINCVPAETGATNLSIQDGTHAQAIAGSIYSATKERTIEEQKGSLHIFSAAPNAFMFYLGKQSRGFGKCLLYEYDFEHQDSCSYSPSINFLD